MSNNEDLKNNIIKNRNIIKKDMDFLFDNQYITQDDYNFLLNYFVRLDDETLNYNDFLKENTIYYQKISYDLKSLKYYVGFYFYKAKILCKAIKYWLNISLNDYIDYEQCVDYNNNNFSNKKSKLEKFDFLKLSHEYVYSAAQFNVGLINSNLGKTEKAKKYFAKVVEKGIKGQALYNLGNIFRREGNIDKAVEYWKKIERESEFFYTAQMNIADSYLELRREDEARKYFLKVKNLSKNYGLYCYAQINLAILYLQDNQDDCANYFIEKALINDDKYINLALRKIFYIDDNGYKKYLLKTLLSVIKLRDTLIVNSEFSFSGDDYEMAIAHYTRPSIAMKLLGENSLFQMSSVNQVNDPSEGKVLINYINKLELKKQKINFEESSDLIPFVGCFTFNHDSLNQFRLYGKEEGKEATGISIILNKNFFNYDHKNIIQDLPENQSKKTILTYEEKLPLYRCIYLDPNGKLGESPYLKIAHRNELTFYRKSDSIPYDLKSYNNYVNIVQNSANKHFQDLIKNIGDMFSIEELAFARDEKFIYYVKHTLNFILLPLNYLIKHSAYQEEQECRILQFLEPQNPEIRKNFQEKRIYKEYLNISAYVERIYLSSGATQYKDMFLSLGVKSVRNSANPFRNK